MVTASGSTFEGTMRISESTVTKITVHSEADEYPYSTLNNIAKAKEKKSLSQLPRVHNF